MFAAALIASSGCTTLDKSDSGVRAGMAAFQDAFNRQDTVGLSAVYTEDAKLMPPNVPVLTGRTAVESFWKGAFTRGVSRIEKTPIDVQVFGESAVETSRYFATVGDKKIAGKDILVWRRDPDGKWRIATDIWNNDQQ